MTTADWIPEPNSVTLPSNVSSTDLFDGDLFGDELIDIYNAAVDERTSTISSNEIANILPPASQVVSNGKPEDISSNNYAAGVAIDDGLGAFRPSTSFNDLATLLPPSTNSVNQPAVTPVNTAVGILDNTLQNGKRVASNAVANEPESKKRYIEPTSGDLLPQNIITTGGASLPKLEKLVSAKDGVQATTEVRVEQKINFATYVDNNTPNPLSLGNQYKQVPAPAPAPLKPTLAIPAYRTAIGPPIVSPNTSTHVKNNIVLPSSVLSAAAVVPVPTLSTTTTVTVPTQPVTTEADFKSVAQAAVSSLIMNAGANKSDPCSDDNSKTVDTSTAHIKALTGSNWVAACSSNNGCSVVSSSAAEAKSNNRARRQNLTPDERARQNRDRNREHARNTRLRKKAYVEELKRTLTELVAQRDSAEVEKRQVGQREIEQREVRFRVIEEFLKLRGRNEANFARWAAILEDGFVLTLPITGFRKMVNIESKHEGIILEQVLTGVSEAMADSRNFATFLQSTVNSTGIVPVSFMYHCDRKNFLMDGNNAVLDWTASSVGAVKNGARTELSMRGSLRAKFSPASNKLLSGNMTFDTGLVMSQLPQLKQITTTNHCDQIAAAAAAAQAASSQADAILDSLQMPQLESAIPSAVMVVPSAVSVVSSADKSENSSDESDGDGAMIIMRESA